MNIGIDMSGFDASLDEAMKAVSPETLGTANMKAGEQTRGFIAAWYDGKGREHWVKVIDKCKVPKDIVVFRGCGAYNELKQVLGWDGEMMTDSIAENLNVFYRDRLIEDRGA